MAARGDVYPAGILPYGSADESVIFRSPLTSAASVTSPEVGLAGVVVDTPMFDSQLGVLCGTAPDYDDGTIRLDTPTDYAKLENGGQLSFEIESVFFGAIVGAAQWGGDKVDSALNEYCISTSATAGGNAPYQLLYWNNTTKIN